MFQPERTYWSLTQQLDTVVIEISVQVLRLRANPQRLQGPNICHPMTMVTQDFKVTKLAILINMKVFTFVKDEKMRFLKPLLTWVMNKNVHLTVGLLHYIPCPHSTFFWWQLMAHLYNTNRHLSIGLCNVFFSSYTTHIQIHNTTMPTFCQANWLPLFIILLQLSPISTHCIGLRHTVFMH